ncbi:sensor histidine kinase [Allofustis seminis]|uniref:sensor histidine kinase n=1 Tax=Allofustis seminis TaxID=166939 RepID=UPI000369ACE3|nr:ATP-binding protein [Allofustis seminis]
MKNKTTLYHITITVSLLLAATIASGLLHYYNVQSANIVMFYLLAVILTAQFTNQRSYGLFQSFASALLINWLFTEPYFTLRVTQSDWIITLIFLVIVSIIMNTLVMHLKEAHDHSQQVSRKFKILYQLTDRLLDVHTEEETLEAGTQALKQALTIDEVELVKQLPQPLPTNKMPLSLKIKKQVPVYGIIPAENKENMNVMQEDLVESIIENIAISLERIEHLQQRQAAERKIEKERLRSNLLRSISHDLRTPLTSIMGSSEWIQQMSEKDEVKKLAHDIYKEATWLTSMVENILSLTRVQTGDLQLHKTIEPLEEVLGVAIERAERMNGHIQIEVDAPNDLLLVPMDAKLMAQVIFNLLENSIRSATAQPKITIQVKKMTDHVAIHVRDFGPGIAEKDLPHVFEMFYTNRGTNDRGRGTGLGLAIVQAIVHAHNGHISVSNIKEHSGAEFVITLPLQKEDESHDTH